MFNDAFITQEQMSILTESKSINNPGRPNTLHQNKATRLDNCDSQSIMLLDFRAEKQVHSLNFERFKLTKIK